MKRHIKAATLNASNILHALSQNGFTRVDSKLRTRYPFWYKDFYNDEYGHFEVRIHEPGYAVGITVYEDVSGRDYKTHEVGRLPGVPTILREESAFDDINKIISKVKTLNSIDYFNTRETMMSTRVHKRSIKASRYANKHSDFERFWNDLDDEIRVEADCYTRYEKMNDNGVTVYEVVLYDEDSNEIASIDIDVLPDEALDKIGDEYTVGVREPNSERYFASGKDFNSVYFDIRDYFMDII